MGWLRKREFRGEMCAIHRQNGREQSAAEKDRKRGKKCLTSDGVCGILRKLSARAAETPFQSEVEHENKSKKI